MKYLLGVAVGLLLSSIPLFFLTNWLLGKDFQNLARLVSFLYEHKFSLACAVGVFVVMALYARQREILQTLEMTAYFYTRATSLRPSDLVPSPSWYNPYFIQRKAVPQTINLLTFNRSAMLVGVPLIGKTRCAFEALRKLRGYHVLSLTPSNKLEVITLPRSWLILKPRVIVFLDDIDRFIGSFDPNTLKKRLAKQSRSVAFLATCRSRYERESIQRDQTFGSFAKLNLNEIRIDELTKTEERQFAVQIGRQWDIEMYNGTPGAIALGLNIMHQRLADAGLNARTLMRSLALIRRAGIHMYRVTLAEKAVAEIYEFKSSRAELDSAWLWLKEETFLVIDTEHGVVSPTHVIYLDEEFYPEYEVRKVDLDVDSLWNLVSVLGNREEIFSMALQWQQLDLFEKSETAFRRYLEIDPGFFGAHYNLANVLFHLGHYEEAEKEFKEAIMIKPSYTDARVNLGNLLRHLERIDEAEQEYREAIRSNPSHVFARSNLAGC